MKIISFNEIIELRGDAGRYKSLHKRAAERLKEQRGGYEKKIDQLKVEHKSQVDALNAKIINLKRQVKTLQDLHFGKSSEGRVSVAGDLSGTRKKAKRKRGQQAGRKGHGRRSHTEVVCEEEILELPEEDARCSICGLPAEDSGLESCSEVVDYEVRIIRKRRRRRQYRRICNCDGVPRLLSVPSEPRALPRSKYTDSFWIETLLFKYEYQFPLERQIRLLEGYGLSNVSSGTLCGGIERCGELLRPLYDEIVRYNKSKRLRHMDETGLKVFVERQDRSSFVWWLWQSSTVRSCVFFLDPTRSYDAPSDYLQETPADGVICADRYKVYQKLIQAIAYCWAHVRRDFVRIGRGERRSLSWALVWLRRIKNLYRLNRKRVNAKEDPEAFSLFQLEVTTLLKEMESELDKELASTNWCFSESRRKTLTSMKNHWDGLTLFLTDPDIPLDNNFAERLFRPVANFRKSCFGVHSEKFGEITAMVLSIFATIKLNNIALRSFLYEYFEAVARTDGHPDLIVEEFLPWTLPLERRERLIRKPKVLNSS